jgi:hypothetical protein
MISGIEYHPFGAQPFVILPGSALAAGAGKLTIAARRLTPASAQPFLGDSAFAVDDTFTLTPAVVNFTGTGSLKTNPPTAKFSGTGSLVFRGRLGAMVRNVFAGAGGFKQQFQGGVPSGFAWAGAGDFDIEPLTYTLSGRVVFPGAGALVIRPIQWTQMRSVFGGASALTVRTGVIDVGAAGTVSLSGAGALATQMPVDILPTGAVDFDGVGALRSGGLLSGVIRRVFAGTGAMVTRTIMTDIIQPGELSIPGQGTLTSRTTQYFTDNLNFPGIGNLVTAEPDIGARGRFSFVGASTLTARGAVYQPIAARMIGAGALNAGLGTKVWATTAAFAGAGQLVVRVGKVEAAVLIARFAGAGALTANIGGALKSGTTIFAGAGLLTPARLFVRERLAAAFQGEGIILPAGLYSLGPARFAGTGFLRVVAPPLRYAEFAWAGTGALTTRLRLRGALRGGFAGSGGIASRVAVQLPGRVVFAGAGGLAVRVVQREAIRIAFHGAGALKAGLTLTFKVGFFGFGQLVTRRVERLRFATVALRGSGSLIVRAVPRQAGRAALAGAGTLTVRGAVRLPTRVAFAGQGVMRTFFGIVLGQGKFAGVGQFTAAASVRLRGFVLLYGRGAAAGNITLAKRLASQFEGRGILRVQPGIVRVPNLGALYQGRGSLGSGGPLPTYAFRATAFAFNGAGRLTTRLPFRVFAAPFHLDGAGKFLLRGLTAIQVGGELAGVGLLDTTSRLRLPSRLYFHGDGALGVDTIQKFAGPVSLDGTGYMFARTGPPILWIHIPGEGQLVTQTWGSIIQTGSQELTGIGKWTADFPGQIVAGTELEGTGYLTVRAPIRRRVVASLVGVSDLYVSEVNRYPLSARFPGVGDFYVGLTSLSRGAAGLAGIGDLEIDPDVKTTLLSRFELKGAGKLTLAPVRDALIRASFRGQSFLYWSDVKLYAGTTWLAGTGGLKIAAKTPIMGINPEFEGAGNLRINARVYRWIGDVEMAGKGALTLREMGKFFTARFTTEFHGDGVMAPVELLRRTYQPGQPPRTLYSPRAPGGRLMKTARRTGTR